MRWRLINIRWYVIFRWFHRFDRFSGYFFFRSMNVLVFLMFNMCMKSVRWLMYVLEGKDIAVCKHCFFYEKFVTSKTKEYFFSKNHCTSFWHVNIDRSRHAAFTYLSKYYFLYLPLQITLVVALAVYWLLARKYCILIISLPSNLLRLIIPPPTSPSPLYFYCFPTRRISIMLSLYRNHHYHHHHHHHIPIVCLSTGTTTTITTAFLKCCPSTGTTTTTAFL